MKELKELESIYLQSFDVKVKPYLSLSQIQKIINEVLIVDSFEERESIIDYLILCYTTDINKEKIDQLGSDIFIQSGLIDEVKKNIKNFDKLMEGISYHESTGKALRMIAKNIPEDFNSIFKNEIYNRTAITE